MAERKIGQNGIVYRESGETVVQIKNQAHLLEQDGVRCLNPDAPETQRVYSKSFKQKRIYLPNELTGAQGHLEGNDTITLGMTGYSVISEQMRKLWGVEEGAYEEACQDILGSTILDLRKEYPTVRPKLVDGASNMGVDKAVIEVANYLNIDHLGFSCPEFLFYVKDDKDPVYVARNRSDYSTAFIKNLDILLSVGGKVQALQHDINAALFHRKKVVLLPVLRALATNGDAPFYGPNGEILDATSAFQDAVDMMSGYTSPHTYAEVREQASKSTIERSRLLLSKEASFGRWRRML